MPTIIPSRQDIDQNTILGRNDAGTGDWEILTAAEIADIVLGHKKQSAGKSIQAAINGAAIGTSAGVYALGTLRAYAWDFDCPQSVDQISAIVTTAGAAGTQFRAAIYANSLTVPNYPGNKITATELLGAGDSTSVQALIFAAQQLYGRKWVVYNASAALASRSIPPSGLPQIGGSNILTTANSQATAYSIAQAFGVLPATFPAGVTPSMNTTVPAVILRVA